MNTKLNPATIIAKPFTICRAIRTKSGVVFNPISEIYLEVDHRVVGTPYLWVPFGSDGIAIVNERGEPIYTFNYNKMGNPYGYGVETMESVCLIQLKETENEAVEFNSNSLAIYGSFYIGEKPEKLYDGFEVQCNKSGVAFTYSFAMDNLQLLSSIEKMTPEDRKVFMEGEELIQLAKKALVRKTRQAQSFAHVAPLGTPSHHGTGQAWNHKITACIPHLDTPELLKVCIETLRAQTERPYIIVIDTGSNSEVCDELESMRDIDLEIHYIKSNGYRHSSELVMYAMDLAQSICNTRYIYHTHSDVFLRRDDYLESLLSLVNEKAPVVGYRMSPRDWRTNDWEWMVGHTSLIMDMKFVHQHGLAWSYAKAKMIYGYAERSNDGWPDTECGFNMALKDTGVRPVFIGYDTNYERYIDFNIDHCRSYTGTKIFLSERYKECKEWAVKAMSEARERISKSIRRPLPKSRPDTSC